MLCRPTVPNTPSRPCPRSHFTQTDVNSVPTVLLSIGPLESESDMSIGKSKATIQGLHQQASFD